MKQLTVSPSPHVHSPASTNRIMLDVVIALLPALLVSFLFYGWSELLVIAVSAVSCVGLEWLIARFVMKRPELFSGSSALVTGLLLAMNLPTTSPWWMIVVGAVVAIGIAKMSFGGLGQNIFNPAITARVFLLISFPVQMTNWAIPIPEILEANGMSAVSILRDIGGSGGEISAVALLVGFVYLLIRKVVKPWIPLSIICTIALISLIFHGIDPDRFTGVAFNLVTGGVLLGAFFMATDYVTSPVSNWGGVVFGVGIGLIVMMIRYFGSYPEGMSFAILIMNCFVPLINRAFHQKKYGRA